MIIWNLTNTVYSGVKWLFLNAMRAKCCVFCCAVFVWFIGIMIAKFEDEWNMPQRLCLEALTWNCAYMGKSWSFKPKHLKSIQPPIKKQTTPISRIIGLVTLTCWLHWVGCLDVFSGILRGSCLECYPRKTKTHQDAPRLSSGTASTLPKRQKKGEIWRRRTLQFLLGVLDDGNLWHFVAKRNNLDTHNPIKTNGSKPGYQDRFPDI